MFDFIRMLELSGINLLLEDMTPAQATGVLKQYGATDDDLAPDKIRSTWIRIVKQYHPDRAGGSNEILAKINAAYDVLSSPTAMPPPSATPSTASSKIAKAAGPSTTSSKIAKAAGAGLGAAVGSFMRRRSPSGRD